MLLLGRLRNGGLCVADQTEVCSEKLHLFIYLYIYSQGKVALTGLLIYQTLLNICMSRVALYIIVFSLEDCTWNWELFEELLLKSHFDNDWSFPFSLLPFHSCLPTCSLLYFNIFCSLPHLEMIEPCALLAVYVLFVGSLQMNLGESWVFGE